MTSSFPQLGSATAHVAPGRSGTTGQEPTGPGVALADGGVARARTQVLWVAAVRQRVIGVAVEASCSIKPAALWVPGESCTRAAIVSMRSVSPVCESS